MISALQKQLGPMLLGSCLALSLAAAAPANAEELRLGFIAPMTGIFAQIGKDMVNGFQMYLDEHGGKLGGAEVKFIVEDSQGKPDTAVTKAKKLVLNDKVHMFIGGLLASTGYALAPVSNEEKTLYISSIPAADDLTQRQADKYPLFFRSGFTSSQPTQPLGQWACDQGYKKIVAIAADYAFGFEFGRRFPEDLRGLRWQGNPEDLAAARHQGLRALHSDHESRRRRHLHADGRSDVAAIPQAVARLREQEADRRRRHQL